MTQFTSAVLGELRAAGLDAADVARVVGAALDEDLRFGPDVTTLSTVRPESCATADVVARERGVLAGVPVALAVLDVAAPGMFTIEIHRGDGDRLEPGDCALTVTGPTVLLLRVERTMLNLLTHLSGVATLTRAWVDAVSGTGVLIRDTRKTTPGLRLLEKYAVRCGGGTNHRFALGDGVLIKDNHVAAAGGVREAVRAVLGGAPAMPLEVECDTVIQVKEAIDAGARLVLLDNMSLDELRESVGLRGEDTVRFEASGGLTLERARDVAAAGVDYLAVGALTHSAPVLDLGLDLRIVGQSAAVPDINAR
jgi:nicotinate-nucleotide pyrophosphorylase (carboxylating)